MPNKQNFWVWHHWDEIKDWWRGGIVVDCRKGPILSQIVTFYPTTINPPFALRAYNSHIRLINKFSRILPDFHF